MFDINNPYNQVTSFNLGQIKSLESPNPFVSNRLLGGFWEQNQLAFCLANPAADSSILAYQLANNLANGIGFDFLDNQSDPQKVLVIDLKNDISTIKSKYATFTLSDPINDPNLQITSFTDQSDAFLQKNLNQYGLDDLVQNNKVQSLIIIGLDKYIESFIRTKVIAHSTFKILNNLRIKYKISILCFADLPEVQIKDFSLKSLPKNTFTTTIPKIGNLFLLKTLNHDNNLVGLKVLKTQNEQFLLQNLVYYVARNVRSFNSTEFEVIKEATLEPDSLTYQKPQTTLELFIIDQYTKNPKISYGEISRRLFCSKSYAARIVKNHKKDLKMD